MPYGAVHFGLGGRRGRPVGTHREPACPRNFVPCRTAKRADWNFFLSTRRDPNGRNHGFWISSVFVFPRTWLSATPRNARDLRGTARLLAALRGRPRWGPWRGAQGRLRQ